MDFFPEQNGYKSLLSVYLGFTQTCKLIYYPGYLQTLSAVGILPAIHVNIISILLAYRNC